ncbi:hypothetical protein AV530_009588 [Patagioenas fasciata monilis]|uniref:LRAT domain-containing protein n=1 Tax=Patagioenas fasciata monilis TaxID=372326 RepID=A0A1V4KN85_PATFA|nr:hypothetical protein AV530_009588 [Patagioenas fasciata monilis]
MMSSSSKCTNVFQHAAVFCGSGEVIHFMASSNAKSLCLISSSIYQGVVVKQGFKALKKLRGKCEIYQKKDGVNLNDLCSEIQKVMDSEAKYSFYENNCIHFTLSLLGLEKFYSQLCKSKMKVIATAVRLCWPTTCPSAWTGKGRAGAQGTVPPFPDHLKPPQPGGAGEQPHGVRGGSPVSLEELLFGRVGDIAFCFLELNCHALI